MGYKHKPKEVQEYLDNCKEREHEILQIQAIKGMDIGTEVFKIISTFKGASFWVCSIIYVGGVFDTQDEVLLGIGDLKIMTDYIKEAD